MSRFFTVSIFVLLLLSPFRVWGQPSGMDFLNIGPNTRALAMGEGTTALPQGGSSIYINPANLAFEPSPSLSATYTIWIADIYSSHLAVNLKRNKDAIAFGLLNSGSSDFEARSTPGPSDGTFSVNYLSLAAAYSRSFKNISLGIAGQFIREEFYVNNASGYALNAGISSHWINERLRVGASVLNIGKMDKLVNESTDLPANIRAGISAEIYEFVPEQDNDLSILIGVSADYIDFLNDDIADNQQGMSYSSKGMFNFGLMCDVAETIVLRGGYKTGETERPLSFGIGINLEILKFDYAMVPFKTGFGTAHSIGLQYYF